LFASSLRCTLKGSNIDKNKYFFLTRAIPFFLILGRMNENTLEFVSAGGFIAEVFMNRVVYRITDISPLAVKNSGIIHRKMLDVVLKYNPLSLLEIGAGQGKMGAEFVKQGIDYVGIEPVESEFLEARRRYSDVRIIQASCYDAPEQLSGRKFELVYSNDVIEHLYEPRSLITFSKSYLKEGGRIICGTPHYGSYFRNLILSLANRWDHHHNPLWDGGHIKFFSKATLYQIWAEAGFVDFEWGMIGSGRFPFMPMYLYCTARMM
jgi:2-polyprenyl-3-methyl-5-hydroxy-6-metoxy-1,4-benzoquinol methylase